MILLEHHVVERSKEHSGTEHKHADVSHLQLGPLGDRVHRL